MDFAELGYYIGFAMGSFVGLAGYLMAFIIFAELLKRLWRGVFR